MTRLHTLHLVLAAALLASMTACATLDKDECLTADWRTIGYEDGINGHVAARIGDHRRACAPYGVKPDLAAYTAGRDAGLRVFCQPARGYRYGLEGNLYKNVCPAPLAGPFEEAYRYGRRIYELDQEYSRLIHRRDSLYGEMEETRKAIAAHEAELVAAGVTPARRARLLDEIKSLSAQAADMEHELENLHATINNLRNERDALRARAPW